MSARRQLTAVAVVAVLGALAQPRSPAAPPAPALELVPPDAAAFLHIRVADLWDGPLGKQLRAAAGKQDPRAVTEIPEVMGLPIGNVDTVTYILPQIGAARNEVVILVATKDVLDKNRLLTTIKPKAPGQTVGGMDVHPGSANEHFVFLADRSFCRVDPSTPESAAAEAQRLLVAGRGPRPGPLRAALDGSAGKAVAGAVNVKALPLPPGFAPPPPLDGLAPLLKADVVTVTLDALMPQTTLAIRADFAAAGDAAAGEKAARDGVRMLAEFLGLLAANAEPDRAAFVLKQLFVAAQAALAKADVSRDGAAVTVKLSTPLLAERGGEIVVAIAELGRKVQAAEEQMGDANKLKDIAIAMHNYHATAGTFPPYAIHKDGKPLLSWRVAILPYVEQDALFKEFKQDEPWDSEHNKKLILRMPKVYLSPKAPPAKEPGMTHYRVFVGGGAVFDRAGTGTRIRDIRDGTSNTLLVVEATEAVPWTKPDELSFDPKQPLPKLGADPKADGFLVAICDGSVRFIRRSVGEKTLKTLITRDGGEPIDRNELDK